MVTILLRGDPATDPAFFSSFAFYQLYTEQISSLTYSQIPIRLSSPLIRKPQIRKKIIPSQMEVAPLHCAVDITQKRRLFKNTKETEKM